MGKQKEEVTRALKRAGYVDDEIHLELTESGRVGGYLVSKKFEGMAQKKRQDTLWKQLAKHLDENKVSKIVAILTMTPAEIEDDLP